MKTPEQLADIASAILETENRRKIFINSKSGAERRDDVRRYTDQHLTVQEAEAARLWLETCMGLPSHESRFYPAYRLSAMPPVPDGYKVPQEPPKPKLDPLTTLQADKSFMAAFRYSYEGPPRWKPAPEQRKIMTFYCKKLGLHLNAEERETLRLQFDAAHREPSQ